MANKPIAIIFAILLIAEVGFIIYAFPAFQDGLESKDWPTTTGTIISSYVVSKEDLTEDDYGPTFSAKVIYEFNVNGQTYESDKIYVRSIDEFTFWDADRSKVQKIVDKYLPGERVTVYYDSDDPNNCALEPGLHFGNYFLFLLSMISFLVLAIHIALFKSRIFGKTNWIYCLPI